MKYFHLYCDADGESHWRDVEVTVAERSFAPPAKAIEVSQGEKARAMLFLRLAPGWDEPIHASPVAQTLVCLQGRVRVTASNGEVREIGAGDVWRMEDLAGKGHHTMVISAESFEAFVAQHG